jgi:hypothetical protein
MRAIESINSTSVFSDLDPFPNDSSEKVSKRRGMKQLMGNWGSARKLEKSRFLLHLLIVFSMLQDEPLFS